MNLKKRQNPVFTLVLGSPAGSARTEPDEGGDYSQGYSAPNDYQANGAPYPRDLKRAPDPVKYALGDDAPGNGNDLLRKTDKANRDAKHKSNQSSVESRSHKIQEPKLSKAAQEAQRQQSWQQQAQNLPPAEPLVSANNSGVKPQVLSLLLRREPTVRLSAVPLQVLCPSG